MAPKTSKLEISKKSERQHQWVMRLMDAEPRILALVKPYDPTKLQPVAMQVMNSQQRMIFDYFRFVISSAPQKMMMQGTGRQAEWILYDKTSGSILGVWAFTDCHPWGTLSEWAGRKIGDPQRGGANTANHIIQLKRCLPLFEFGDLTGGKLMALCAASREVLQAWELRYSFNVVAMYVTTLHGKSSQYNRLHSRGLQYLGVYDGVKGLYIQEFYENAKTFLREETKDPGKWLVHSYQEQVDYWKERWLPNRLGRVEGGIVRPDPERYRLTRVFKERRLILDDHEEEQ